MKVPVTSNPIVIMNLTTQDRISIRFNLYATRKIGTKPGHHMRIGCVKNRIYFTPCPREFKNQGFKLDDTGSSTSSGLTIRCKYLPNVSDTGEHYKKVYDLYYDSARDMWYIDLNKGKRRY